MSLLRGAVAAIALSIPMVVASFPAPVAARDLGYPLPGHRPTFVTEREAGKWEDCLWASSSMLLDKWSVGRVKISPNRLRALSGDRRGGSSFDDLRRAAKRLGVNLRTSPDGGARITWRTLLRRLKNGGGAVLLGDYHDLPRWYGRWDPGFWKNTGRKDNHALYLDRANRAGTRIWVMDPLAPAGWKGEWIPVSALRAYAWQTRSGALWAVMTPKARPAPFAGVRLAESTAQAVGSTVEVAWPIRKAPRRWRLPQTRIESSFTPVDVPLVPPAESIMLAASTDRPQRARLTLEHKQLVVTAGAPKRPGVYRVTIGIRERRFGKVVVRAEPLTVYVAGERRASISVELDEAVVHPKDRLIARVVAINTGFTDWADPRVPATEFVPRRTRLALRWVDASDPARVVDVDRVIPLQLESRRTKVLDIGLTAPGPGEWYLVAGATDAIDGPFATSGSREGVARLTVLPQGTPLH